MKKIGIMLVLLALTLCWTVPCLAQTLGTTTVSYGISTDGITYTVLNVEVPNDGWVRANFSGQWVWVWSETITPTAWDAMEADIISIHGDLLAICGCDRGTGSCQCGGTCAYQGSYGHTCNKWHRQ